jgi:DNA-binding NarL/FixJ family response regulator
LSEARALRLVVVDDTADFRATLVDLLDTVHGVEVVGQAESGEQAVRVAKLARPDVVILDLSMPVTGWSAIRALRRSRPLVKIIVLTASGEELQQEALRAGADAFVRKVGRRDLLEELTDALRRVTGLELSSRNQA